MYVCTVGGQHLQGPGSVGRVGLLRRVQPDLGGGAVGGRRAGQVHPGRDQGAQEGVQLHRRGDPADAERRPVHHDEPGLRGARRAAGEPQGALQASGILVHSAFLRFSAVPQNQP